MNATCATRQKRRGSLGRSDNGFAPRARVEPLYTAAHAGKPDLKLTIIDHSYHFIMFDQPEAFEAALRAGLGDAR